MSANILAIVVVALLQAAPTASPQDPDDAKPVDVVAAKVGLSPGALLGHDLVAMTDEAFAERASDAQFVLVGEDHRDECDHAVQVRLLDALAKAGLHPVLGMEMVGADQQAALDLFNARRIEAARLDDALAWDQNWNVDFRQYLPLLERAEAWQTPVVALNIPPYLSFLVAEGRLKTETVHPRWLLPQALPPVPQGDVPMLEEEPGIEDQFVPPFVPVVRSAKDVGYLHLLQDSQMALSAQQAASKYSSPVIVVAGVSHVAYGGGISNHLRQPASAILAVLPWRGEAAPDPRSADLFFFCPAQ